MVLFLVGCVSESVVMTPTKQLVFPPPPDPARFYFERTILSSADVVLDDEDASLRRALTGEVRTGVGLGKPFGIAVHRNRIFVSDTQRRSVMVFDDKEHKFFEIGTKQPGMLAKPLGMDVDAQGNLYVVDGSARIVNVYTRDGVFLRSIGQQDTFSRPTGIAVSQDGSAVYVADTGGVDSDKHHILVFDALTGEHLRNIAERGSMDGQLNLPRELVLSPVTGLLYVVDGGNFRVQSFNTDGTFVRAFGGIGRRGGQFSRPKGIGIDRNENIYVTDTAFGNFQIFNTEGQLLLSVGTRGAAGEPATYMLLAGLTVDETGRVYVVDQYARKIDVFRPASLDRE
jgi:DNA-binding beta-propeller fold protein YncE